MDLCVHHQDLTTDASLQAHLQRSFQLQTLVMCQTLGCLSIMMSETWSLHWVSVLSSQDAQVQTQTACPAGGTSIGSLS